MDIFQDIMRALGRCDVVRAGSRPFGMVLQLGTYLLGRLKSVRMMPVVCQFDACVTLNTGQTHVPSAEVSSGSVKEAGMYTYMPCILALLSFTPNCRVFQWNMESVLS